MGGINQRFHKSFLGRGQGENTFLPKKGDSPEGFPHNNLVLNIYIIQVRFDDPLPFIIVDTACRGQALSEKVLHFLCFPDWSCKIILLRNLSLPSFFIQTPTNTMTSLPENEPPCSKLQGIEVKTALVP